MTATPELILHHYDMSPFSEKVRRALAHKKLAWRAVAQPMWLPRPFLTPLTGPYRRIPVLQIGADIYCDTRLILRKLEQISPEHPLVPVGLEAAADSICQWADRHIFAAVVPQVFTGLAAVMPAELLEDRRKMRPDLDPAALAEVVPDLRNELRAFVASCESTLSHCNFLLGEEFSAADAAVYHVFWFARNEPGAGAILGEFPGVSAWLARIDAMGHGEPSEMSPQEAMEIARAATPACEESADGSDPNGLSPGTRVGVFADDLPSDVVEGTLTALGADTVALVRESNECGKVAMHFPRAGYRIRTL